MSNPPSHATEIIRILCIELALHLGLFEGNERKYMTEGEVRSCSDRGTSLESGRLILRKSFELHNFARLWLYVPDVGGM